MYVTKMRYRVINANLAATSFIKPCVTFSVIVLAGNDEFEITTETWKGYRIAVALELTLLVASLSVYMDLDKIEIKKENMLSVLRAADAVGAKACKARCLNFAGHNKTYFRCG